MSSSLRRGALAAASIAFSIASLAACGAGSNAQTLQIKPDNAATTVGNIKIQNALVITQPDPQSTGPAVISATVFNNGRTPQTLDSIKVGGAGVAQITPAKGSGRLTVPAGGSVVLGGKGNASAILTNPGAAVSNGNAEPVIFSFSRTGAVNLRAYVVPAESYFSKWGPSNIPAVPGASGSAAATASASATATSSAGHKPSKSTSGAPSKSSTATATATATASQSAGH